MRAVSKVWVRAGETPQGQRSCHHPLPQGQGTGRSRLQRQSRGKRPLPPATHDPPGRRRWSRGPASLSFLPPSPHSPSSSQTQPGSERGQAMVPVRGSHTATWAHGSSVAKHQTLPDAPVKGQECGIRARNVLGASRAPLPSSESPGRRGLSGRKGARAAWERLPEPTRLRAHGRAAGGRAPLPPPGCSSLLGGRVLSLPQTTLGKLRHPHPPSRPQPSATTQRPPQPSPAQPAWAQGPSAPGESGWVRGRCPPPPSGPGFLGHPGRHPDHGACSRDWAPTATPRVRRWTPRGNVRD